MIQLKGWRSYGWSDVSGFTSSAAMSQARWR